MGLKKAWSDGTTAIELSPSELVERLSAIIPPPRANTIIYRGVLAGNSAWRKEVIPKPPEDRRAARTAVKLARGSRINEASERVPWAELLKRVFKRDGYECGWCGGRMVLRCVVVGQAAGRILAGLERATGPLPAADRAQALSLVVEEAVDAVRIRLDVAEPGQRQAGA